MRRTDCSEVPLVERRDLVLAELLRDGDDARVDEAQIHIGIATPKLEHSVPGACVQVVHDKAAVGYRREHLIEGRLSEPAARDPLHFDEDGHGDDQLLVRVPQKIPAGHVVRIAEIHGREDGSGVDDQRQGCGSGETSLASRAVGPLPGSLRPTPKKCRRSPCRAIRRSMPWRITAARDKFSRSAMERRRANTRSSVMIVVRFIASC